MGVVIVVLLVVGGGAGGGSGDNCRRACTTRARGRRKWIHGSYLTGQESRVASPEGDDNDELGLHRESAEYLTLKISEQFDGGLIGYYVSGSFHLKISHERGRFQ
jgi:hypothetical protein